MFQWDHIVILAMMLSLVITVLLSSHVVVKGPSTIGSGNHIFQFASVGEACQDKKYNNEPTSLTIGDRNIIRECVTIHRGTIQDQGVTIIGSNNLFMAYTHVALRCSDWR